MALDPMSREAADGSAESRPMSRFAMSAEDLERSAHVPAEDQVVEIPSTEPGRAPGDDDFTRNLRGVINPGL